MLQDSSNYVWQLAWIINEFTPCYSDTLFSPTNVNSNIYFLLQIRAEKAYYIADPEVDSLVS